MYDGDLTGKLWATVCERNPALARSIDNAEAALNTAAVAYTNGAAPTDAQFKARLAWWTRTWTTAIEEVSK